MKKWKVDESETVFVSPYFNVVKDTVVDFTDRESDYWKINASDGVLVVPIRLANENKDVSYVMVEQYRHPPLTSLLEFPKGSLNKEESTEAAAKRELKEETGLAPKWIKFMHSFYPSPSRSAAKMFIYLALVDGETSDEFLEPSEVGSDFKVVEVSATELLTKIQKNEIRDGATLAALASVMLQTKEALRYIESVGQ